MSLRSYYHSALEKTTKRIFHLAEACGVHITPANFYSPIPTLADLDESLFSRLSSLDGINMHDEAQLQLLTQLIKYTKEYLQFGVDAPTRDFPYYVKNGTFGEIDGDVLYALVRHLHPKNVIEIGCGWSTRLIDKALVKNECAGSLVCIDPYPKPWLLSGEVHIERLIASPIQKVELTVFDSLQSGDILFIDSTHVVKTGSDVCHEIFNILPRLKPGVLIHFHDIFMPEEYPKEWLFKNNVFWNETYLLQAFLMHNDSYQVYWAGNYLKLKYPELLRSSFRGNCAQSFWIEKL